MINLIKISINKIKKLNWTVFLLIFCISEIGVMGNKNIENFNTAFLLGLMISIIFGIPIIILTREKYNNDK